jgi:hypothetical protein
VSARWDVVEGCEHDALDPEKTKQFLSLPYIAVRRRADQPPFPDALATYAQDYLWLLQALDRIIARKIDGKEVDLVNLSLGFEAGEFDEREPVHVATRAIVELGVPVVVAAGNSGPRDGSLQRLARAPWVIAVGAVDSSEKLLPRSSRGSPEGPYPTVVADGFPTVTVPGIPPVKPGTSVATAKVSGIVAWVKRCLELTIANFQAQQEGSWTALSEPLAFPIVAVPDSGIDSSRLTPRNSSARSFLERGQTRVQIGRQDRERAWYQRVTSELVRARLPCALSSDPAIVKRALTLAARPLTEYEPHEVGSGLISNDQMIAFLSSLVPSRWLGLFCPDVLVHASFRQHLGKLDLELGPLWNVDHVTGLNELFQGGVRTLDHRIVP